MVVYLSSSGVWNKTIATSSIVTQMVGLALSANPSDSNLLLHGFYGLVNTFTIGAPLYISNTVSGGLEENVGAFNSGDYVRIFAYCVNDELIYVKPDPTWVQLP